MSTSGATEWAWVQRYAEVFAASAVHEGEVAVLLSETRSRASVVTTARLALQHLGARVADVVLATPANPGPVPIRSTGASQAIAGNPAAIAACAAADIVVDCTVEGLLHAPELGAILGAGARVLMISNEHPENAERWPVDPDLAGRVTKGLSLLEAADTLRITSRLGTDLTVELAGSFRVSSHGATSGPGTIAHWPGGLVLAFPAAGAVSGTVVLAPGDANLTFKTYFRDAVTLTVVADTVVDIAGDGADAVLLRDYLASFGEPEAFATSHIGWGMNTGAQRTAMALWDKGDHNGTELRAVAGNVVFSTGANEVAGRFCRGHVDLPMFGCSVWLDDTAVVTDGVLCEDLA
ncbi:MAG: hypothetical protein KDB21_08735 [Acidimicrobiales bacterium]|nr:hypothetical protein [Acidimicrobiales bacterium]